MNVVCLCVCGHLSQVKYANRAGICLNTQTHPALTMSEVSMIVFDNYEREERKIVSEVSENMRTKGVVMMRVCLCSTVKK